MTPTCRVSERDAWLIRCPRSRHRPVGVRDAGRDRPGRGPALLGRPARLRRDLRGLSRALPARVRRAHAPQPDRQVRAGGGGRRARVPGAVGSPTWTGRRRTTRRWAAGPSGCRPGRCAGSARSSGSRTRSGSWSTSSTASDASGAAAAALRPAARRRGRAARPLQHLRARRAARLRVLLRARVRAVGDHRGRPDRLRRLDVPQADRARHGVHRRRRAAPAPPGVLRPRAALGAADLRHHRVAARWKRASSAGPGGTASPTRSTCTCATRTGTGWRSTPPTTTPATRTTRCCAGRCSTRGGATSGATRSSRPGTPRRRRSSTWTASRSRSFELAQTAEVTVGADGFTAPPSE